jgi:peptide/nickel transport system permease protein
MGLKSFVAKRIVYSLFLVLFVLTLNFVIFELMPGDPTSVFAATGKLTKEQILQVISMYGFDQPLHIRYFKYLYNMLTFQFGYSYSSHVLVSEEMTERLVNTLLLAGGSELLAMLIGILLGVLAASRRGGILDSSSVVGSLVTYSVPSFWLGMVMLLIFHFHLGWFPGAGTVTRGMVYPNILAAITDRLWHLALPLATLTLFMYGGWLLITRAVMLETLTEDYITTARAKGISERQVLLKHALRNAALPLITQAALSFGFTLSGAIITEQVFTYHGLGQWLWSSIYFADYPVLQAMFYIIALCVIIANFGADLIYGIIDPRIKYG